MRTHVFCVVLGVLAFVGVVGAEEFERRVYEVPRFRFGGADRRVEPGANLVFVSPRVAEDLAELARGWGPRPLEHRETREMNVDTRFGDSSTGCHDLFYELLDSMFSSEDEGFPGRMDYSPDGLEIEAPLAVHRELGELIRALHANTSLRFSVTCALVPHGELDRIAPRWRNSDVLEERAFTTVLASERAAVCTLVGADGERLVSGWSGSGGWELAAPRTHLLVPARGDEERAVLSIESAVRHVPAGIRVEVAPVLVREGLVLLDVLVRRRQAEPGESGTPKCGARLGRESLLSADLLARDGVAFVAASWDDLTEGSYGAAVVLHVRAAPSAPPGQAVIQRIDRVMRSYRVGAVVGGGRYEWESGWLRWPEPLGSRRVSSIDEVQEVLYEATRAYLPNANGEDQDPSALWQIESLGATSIVEGPRPIHDLIADRLAELERRFMRSCDVRLSIVEGPRAELAEVLDRAIAGEPLVPAWRAALSKPGVRERAFGGLSTTMSTLALRDAELSTIATAASVAVSPVPLSTTYGEGFELRLRARLDERAPRARLQVRGAIARVEGVRAVPEQELVFPPFAPSEGLAAGGSHVVTVDAAPRQTVTELELDVELPLDRDVLLRAETLEGGDTRLVVARVSEVVLDGARAATKRPPK